MLLLLLLLDDYYELFLRFLFAFLISRPPTHASSTVYIFATFLSCFLFSLHGVTYLLPSIPFSN